jgi:hypothetical protein
MNQNQANKVVNSVVPESITSASGTVTNTVDCKDWDYCQIYVIFGAVGAAVAALKIQEADDNSTFTDVVGTRVGTDTDMAGAATTLPSTANVVFRFDVDCRNRKRYLKPIVTAGAGATLVSAIAVLSRGAIGPHVVADTGATDVMRV